MSALRCLAYNVNGGHPDKVEPLAGVIKEVNADIVALTEADHAPAIAALAERLQMHYIWERGSGDRHVATLSRLALPETELTIYNVHLLPYLLLPFEVRRWQAVGKLLQVIRNAPPGPHLIVGDLNAIGPGDHVLHRRNPARMRRVMALQLNATFRFAVPRLLRAGYVDCYRTLHPREDGFTFLTGNPTTRYDYMLADPHMAGALCACHVVENFAGVEALSDHYPLLAEFELDDVKREA
ncbi:MAG: endonuclease/exonuclease/phosphatase family protein [Anaerolineales bacterium]